ncbi:HET-domain-containing protein [Astrocystis sublimbata]|nr:HET-domain-containing protein [Astrocystis sublimbata]
MYDSLDQSKHQIRLLRLLPGHNSAEIHCELFTVSLDGSNEFEALSYVWGSNENPLQINLGGQTTNVTRNLGLALQHLRNEGNERIIWVDAICINQNDKEERTHQVQLMQRIYSGASQVVVWLGLLMRNGQQTIAAIKRLGSNSALHWTQIPDMEDLLPGIFFFLRHEWWLRIWTVQEAVLAQRLIYQCGNTQFWSRNLIDVAASYREHIDTKGCCETLKFPSHGMATASDVTLATENIIQLRHFQLRSQNYSFDKVASLFRHRRASDPLDKVYGLLGISSGIEKPSIDYNFSKAKVYQLTAGDSISHNKNLDILSHVFHETTRLPREHNWTVRWPPSTPTWVPDWAAAYDGSHDEIHLIRYRIPFLDHYDACGELTYKATTDKLTSKLQVAGVCCDTIKAISNQVNSRSIINPSSTIKDWRRIAGIEEAPSKSYVGGGTVSEAFWRTLCLDMSAPDVQGDSQTRPITRASDLDRGVYLAFWYMHLSGHNVGIYTKETASFTKKVFGFHRHIGKTVTRRQFFISQKGYMGLAPLGVEIGDCIYVLAGGRAAFIVRAVEQEKSHVSSGLIYRLLGDLYVHGLMDGEASKLVSEGALQLDTIKLA